MEFHNGKVYVATVDEQGFKPYLYSSLNPEIYPQCFEYLYLANM